MEKIGIDVHKVATQVCVLTEDGEYAESRIRTERGAQTAFFGERPRARILLEAAHRERVGGPGPRIAGSRSDRGRPELRAHVCQPQPKGKDRQARRACALRSVLLGCVSSCSSFERCEQAAAQAAERARGAGTNALSDD
jgi:hypothetical protein